MQESQMIEARTIIVIDQKPSSKTIVNAPSSLKIKGDTHIKLEYPQEFDKTYAFTQVTYKDQIQMIVESEILYTLLIKK